MPRPKKVEEPKPKRTHRGRPRVNFEFHEARELVRNEQLRSVIQYKKWWALNTPAKIPKRPDRAYKNEWLGWSDFLGTDNPFPCVKRSFRPFKEARSFVHQLGIKNKDEWFEYTKSGRKPEDIPSRPDLIYREEWFTWKDFWGADIPSVKRNIDLAEAVFFIIQNSGRPHNVFQMGITLEGVQTVIQAQATHRFRIVGMFYCDIGFDWQSIANRLGRQYLDLGRSDEYMIRNINEFIFHIEDHVERVR